MRSHDLAVWNHSIDQYEAPLRERDEFEHLSSQFNHKINLSSSRTFLINKRAIMFVFCVCVCGCSVFLKSLSSGSKTLQTSCFSQHEVWKSALFFTLKFLCFFVYTCRISIPYLQIVKSADGPHRCGCVRFHIEALEVQNDLCHLGCKDDEGALQVVWILIRETRGLNHSVWLSEVSGTFSTCTECKTTSCIMLMYSICQRI